SPSFPCRACTTPRFTHPFAYPGSIRTASRNCRPASSTCPCCNNRLPRLFRARTYPRRRLHDLAELLRRRRQLPPTLQQEPQIAAPVGLPRFQPYRLLVLLHRLLASPFPFEHHAQAISCRRRPTIHGLCRSKLVRGRLQLALGQEGCATSVEHLPRPEI